MIASRRSDYGQFLKDFPPNNSSLIASPSLFLKINQTLLSSCPQCCMANRSQGVQAAGQSKKDAEVNL